MRGSQILEITIRRSDAVAPLILLLKHAILLAGGESDAATKARQVLESIQSGQLEDTTVSDALAGLFHETGRKGPVVLLIDDLDKAKESFREALAMGLEDVTLIEDPFDGEGGPSVTAIVLAEAIQKLGDVDLIICGEVSDDGFTYQVPPRLAERLKLPQISYARQITIEDGQAVVDKELDNSAQKVQAKLPAVISVTEETNTPRRPTLMEALKAKKKPVHLWQVDTDLGLSKDDLVQRIKVEKVATKGVVIHRKRELLKGSSAAELANQLLDLLLKETVITEGGA